MTCDACAAAQSNPFSDLQTAGCRGCYVRHLSNQPHHLRVAYYERLGGDEERTKLMREVNAEHNRRKALARENRAEIVLREVA